MRSLKLAAKQNVNATRILVTEPRCYFATCARGIETVLAQELHNLGASGIEAGRGGVHFQGDQSLLYWANLWLRTPIRILVQIMKTTVTSPEDLYDAVRRIDWSEYLTPDHTLAIDCNVRDSHLTHSHYAALKTKDAVCDQFMDRCGRRPSVDVEEPMVGLNLHVYRDEAVLSLDSSGASLHKRGYRPILTKAPLNEALAAALILHTGFDGDAPFLDPMCGSGTLPIEAAWIALRRAPGLTRRRFGFQGWMDYDVRLWTRLRDEARRSVLRQLPHTVTGYDVRNDAITFAEKNARAAGIGHLLTFAVRDVRELQPIEGPPGVLLCNPPYGERIGDETELRGLYRTLGDVLQQRFANWTAFVFTGNSSLARQIGLPVAARWPLFNGKIRCELLRFNLT
jgi:putative N6-adenine-specific DNA methylase